MSRRQRGRALHRRYGRAEGGEGELARLLSGRGPYFYEHDIDLNLLRDIAKAPGSRKLPPPSHSVVHDGHYTALARAGFIHWKQDGGLSLDRYELTPKGKRAIETYRAWIERTIKGVR